MKNKVLFFAALSALSLGLCLTTSNVVHADGPGTNYWTPSPNPSGGGNSGGGYNPYGDIATNWGYKVAECIAYGLSLQRGPFGCNS